MKAFNDIKQAFCNTILRQHPNFEIPFHIEVDSSDFGMGGVLSQKDSNGNSAPIAFFSRKFSPTEINYSVYDKELLAIVTACKEWRHFIQGSQHSTIILTDHKNLEFL